MRGRLEKKFTFMARVLAEEKYVTTVSCRDVIKEARRA